MKQVIKNIVTGIVVAAFIVVGFISGVKLDALQIETIKTLCIICGCSVLFCFVVGEISRNNSQMDKLWSILPIAYAWVVAGKGGMGIRLVLMAILITIWGIRLTYNFGKKGAYSIKFWTGEEDYRWPILRKTKPFTNKFVWALFDLIFISGYQNILVLIICFPMVACMSSTAALGVMDIVAVVLTLACIVYETIADAQQMEFQTIKWAMIKQGKKLEELPYPYNKGFNTKGLWALSRHPNYLAEQSTWVCIYLFTIAAGVTTWGIFNWTIVGCMLLILLFMGSSTFGEKISSGKYLEYKEYQEKVSKFIPLPNDYESQEYHAKTI